MTMNDNLPARKSARPPAGATLKINWPPTDNVELLHAEIADLITNEVFAALKAPIRVDDMTDDYGKPIGHGTGTVPNWVAVAISDAVGAAVAKVLWGEPDAEHPG